MTAPIPTPEAKSISEIAWSHSSVNEFENCPHSYYRKRVSKDAKDEGGSAALDWGNDVHEAMENYMRSYAAMPQNVIQYQPFADEVHELRVAGNLRMEVEEEICVDANWAPASWFSKKAFMRAKADVALYSDAGGFAINIDWKTNKRYYGLSGQDARNAAAMFLWNPSLNVVETRFIYLGLNKRVVRRYTRPQLPQLLAPSLQTVNDIARAYQTGTWPKKPSGLCKFCPVKDCEHKRK